MKTLPCAIALVVLAGCAATNPVLTEAQWTALKPAKRDKGGVVFSLPQTRFVLAYTLEKKTFRAGAHTLVVDACRPKGALNGQAICAQLHAANIKKSLRLSAEALRAPGNRICTADGSDTETRVGLAEGAALNADFVPDSSQVYVIPLQRSYFQNFELTLELNANGTIGKGSLSTENLGSKEFLDALVKVVGMAAAAAAPGAGAAAAKLAKPDPVAIKAAGADLDRLLRLEHIRDEIAARNDDVALASRSVQLSELGAQIARLRAAFVGSVTTVPDGSYVERWIPSAASLSQQGQPFDLCGIGSERPFRVELRVDSGAALAPMASGTLAANSFEPARGWPYRIPAERDLIWRVCSIQQPPNCEDIDSKRMLVAQFGTTLRLPAATGGRKSVIAPEYFADGSLKKLDISHVGESPAPLIAGAQALLTPHPDAPAPSETATLTSAAALISARQALCRLVFAVSVTDPKCLGPNPPTTLPSGP